MSSSFPINSPKSASPLPHPRKPNNHSTQRTCLMGICVWPPPEYYSTEQLQYLPQDPTGALLVNPINKLHATSALQSYTNTVAALGNGPIPQPNAGGFLWSESHRFFLHSHMCCIMISRLYIQKICYFDSIFGFWNFPHNCHILDIWKKKVLNIESPL